MKPAAEAHWLPFVPTESTPWKLRRVHHLHRRAGFGANWGELQRSLQAGPEAVVDWLLKGGDLQMSVDFRDIYQEVTTHWLGLDGNTEGHPAEQQLRMFDD